MIESAKRGAHAAPGQPDRRALESAARQTSHNIHALASLLDTAMRAKHPRKTTLVISAGVPKASATTRRSSLQWAHFGAAAAGWVSGLVGRSGRWWHGPAGWLTSCLAVAASLPPGRMASTRRSRVRSRTGHRTSWILGEATLADPPFCTASASPTSSGGNVQIGHSAPTGGGVQRSLACLPAGSPGRGGRLSCCLGTDSRGWTCRR